MKISKIKLFGLSLFAGLIMFTSCDKHEDAQVNINITSPTANAEFNLGDTIKIKANVTSNVEMHGYEVIIKNLSAGTIAFITDYHEHTSSFNINEQWIINVTNHSDMRLIINVEVDHDGHTVSDSLNFHCHPM